MSNSRRSRRVIKTSTWDAMDQLPLLVRRALYEGPQEWCPVYTLHHYRKLVRSLGEDAVEATVVWLETAHAEEIERAKPWQKKRGQRLPSPHVLAGATMQRAYVGGHITIDPQQQEA